MLTSGVVVTSTSTCVLYYSICPSSYPYDHAYMYQEEEKIELYLIWYAHTAVHTVQYGTWVLSAVCNCIANQTGCG